MSLQVCLFCLCIRTQVVSHLVLFCGGWQAGCGSATDELSNPGSPHVYSTYRIQLCRNATSEEAEEFP